MISKPLIIVPTYNEADNVDSLTKAIQAHAPQCSILFVDDNSQDGTRTKIRALMDDARKHNKSEIYILERAGKLGLGSAYVAGFRWALNRDFDAVIEMDADHSHDPADLPRMIQMLNKHDVVVGSRYVAGGGTVNWSWVRKIISKGGSFYGRMILGMNICDFTGGFNGWRRRVVDAINPESVKSEGYAFQIELKYRAHRLGFDLQEMPIIFHERRAGQSKMSWRIVVEAMWRVWQFRSLELRPSEKEV